MGAPRRSGVGQWGPRERRRKGGRRGRSPPGKSLEQFDIVIVGSGAGGGTMAHALADTGARILVVERGDVLPSEDENWDPSAVWQQLRYRTTEHWLDGDGRDFRRYMHYVVGGNTKFWGGGAGTGSGARTSRRPNIWTVFRRPGRFCTTRSLRTMTVPSACIRSTASTASIPPSRPEARSPIRRLPISHGCREWLRSSAARVCTLLRCRSDCSGRVSPAAACCAARATPFRAASG